MDYIDKITALRQDNDLTQSDIAKVLGTTQTAISKYELRQRKYTVEDIIKLCNYYRISSDDLLGIKYPKR